MADEEIKIEVTAVDKTAAAVASVKRNLQGIDQTANKLTTAFKGLEVGMGNAMRSFTTGMIQGAGIGAFNMLMSLPGQIAAASGAAMQSYAQFERLGMSINSLTAKEALQSGQAKSMTDAMALTSGKAKELVDWIQKLAVDSPFDSSDISSTFRMAMGMGFLSKEAQRVTKDLLDFVSATGAEPEVMERITLALGKVRTTGKITGETLQQLGEAGLNATTILADAFGKTPQEISKMISAGQVDANKALDAILASVEKFYGGAAKAQANSFSGILSSFEEIKNNTLRDFFAPAFQGLQPYMADVTGAFSSPEFKAITEKLGTMFGEGLTGTLTTVVKGAQDIGTAIKPLLDAETPAWMTTLTALFAAGNGQNLAVWIEPKIKDGGGVTFDTASGSYTLDFQGRLQSFDFNQLWGTEPAGVHWVAGKGLTFDSKINIISVEGLSEANLFPDWGTGLPKRLATKLIADATAEFQKSGVVITADWGTGVSGRLWTAMQNAFSTPFSVYAEWVSSGLGNLWTAAQDFFKARPIVLGVTQTTAPIYGPSMTPSGTTSNTKFPIDVTQPYPQTNIWDIAGRASGGPVQGWAMVGERGPELAFFGRNGGHVFSNPDTRKLLGGIPGYADGSTEFGGALRGLIGTIASSLGIKGKTYGPKTLGETGWIDFTKKGTQAMQQVAESATKAFEVSAKKVAEVFKGALGSVPGLNGLSQVTDLDMQKAKAGMKVSYADDYIRQLSDEVLNKKDWGDKVDIKDAAKRAGIDPNLPNELILELVKQAWADKSFFANPANLELINKNAVQADMEQQQKEARGSANLLGFFGLDNTNEATQAAALGQAIQGAFGAIPVEILSSTGQTMMLHLTAGFTDPQTNVTAITNLGGALVTAMGTEAGAAAISVSGITLADAQYAAYAGRMGELPAVTPSGTGTTTPPAGTTPPGKAVGTGYWQGGLVSVHKDETIYLPTGSAIMTATQSRQMQGAAPQVIQVTVSRALDEEAVVNRIMQKIRRRTN